MPASPRWPRAPQEERAGVPRCAPAAGGAAAHRRADPGTMGSAMSARDRAVWLEYFALLRRPGRHRHRPARRAAHRSCWPISTARSSAPGAHAPRRDLPPTGGARCARPRATRGAAARSLLPEAERTRPSQCIWWRTRWAAGGARDDRRRRRRTQALAAHERAAGQPPADALGTPNLGSHGRCAGSPAPTRPGQARAARLHRSTEGVIDIVRLPRPRRAAALRRRRCSLGPRCVPGSAQRAIGAGFPLAERRAAPPRPPGSCCGAMRPAAHDLCGGLPERHRDRARGGRRTIRLPASSCASSPRARGDGTVSWASGRLAEGADLPTHPTPATTSCAATPTTAASSAATSTCCSPARPTSCRHAARPRAQPALEPTLRAAAAAGGDDLPTPPRCAVSAFGGSRPRRRALPRCARRNCASASAMATCATRATRCWWATTPATPSSARRSARPPDEGRPGAGPADAATRPRPVPGPHGTHAVFFNDDPTASPWRAGGRPQPGGRALADAARDRCARRAARIRRCCTPTPPPAAAGPRRRQPAASAPASAACWWVPA